MEGPWGACPFLRVLLCGNKAPSSLPRVCAPQEAPPGSGAGGGGSGGAARAGGGMRRGRPGAGRGEERPCSAMGRPVLLVVAAALLLLQSGTGAAVTRLRVSANFVSAGEGRWWGKVGGGQHRAHRPLFACRSAGPEVSSGGAGLSARGCSCPAILAPGGGGMVGFPLPAATGSWRMEGEALPFSGAPGSPLPRTPDPRNFLAPGAPRFLQRLRIPEAPCFRGLPIPRDSPF